MKTKYSVKKLLGVVLCIVLALSLALPAFADDEAGSGEIPAAEELSVPEPAPEQTPDEAAAEPGPESVPEEAAGQEPQAPEDESGAADPEGTADLGEDTGGSAQASEETDSAAPADEAASGSETGAGDAEGPEGTDDIRETGDQERQGGSEGLTVEETDEGPEERNASADGENADASGAKASDANASNANASDAEETVQEETEQKTAEKAASVPEAADAAEDGAAPMLLASSFDNSTKLPDGEYTDFTFEWGGGTGKLKFFLERIVVSGGKATGYFTTSSSSLTHIWYLGARASEGDDKSLFDPTTGKTGEGVVEVTDKAFSIPVKLNQQQDFSGRTTAMSVPHWVAYYYNIGIDESIVKEPADYSKVEAALARVPEDLSGYKKSRVKALQKAIDAVVYGLFEDEQARVDGFAKDIEKAVAALEKETLRVKFKAVDKKTGKRIKTARIVVRNAKGKTVKAVRDGVYELEDGKYTVTASAKNYRKNVVKSFRPSVEETVRLELEPKEKKPAGTIIFREDPDDPSKTNLFNTTTMFRVVKGTLAGKGSKTTLTVVLNGAGYHYLYKGTYEEAVANGPDKGSWIAGSVNADGKWEFVIPLSDGETYIPLAAVSQRQLEGYEAGELSIDQIFFERQLVLDLKKKTLTAGDYNAVEKITVASTAEQFKVVPESTMEVVGCPNSNNYACKPVIAMADGLYTKAFLGTAEEAAGDGAAVIGAASGFAVFRFELVNSFGENGKVIMFEDKKPVAVAFYNSDIQKWEDYKLTIDKAASLVTIEALGSDETPPENPAKPEETQDDSAVTTSAVDASTGLADGTYTPDSFSFSGGTGKVLIVCDGVEVKGGQTYAVIRFTKPGGGAASVDMLRANGQVYNGNNVFTIPVTLNRNNAIVARTTAMSQPHWVEYSIFIALAAAGEAQTGADVSENTGTMDEEAPAILGLKAKGEVETPYSDLIRIFEYEGGYYLIELDAVRDTARDTLEYRTEMEYQKLNPDRKDEKTEAGDDVEEAEPEKADEAGEGGDDEEGSSSSVSISELIAGLYENEIIKYLVIPEGKEVPAGMDKEVIIISQPADKTYISSEDAFRMIADLGAEKNILATGLEEFKDSDEYAWGGTCDDWDLRTFIMKKINLAIQSSEILPSDDKTLEKDLENMIRLGERSAQMDIGMFVDRSSDEKNGLAKAEWYKVYGVIYNCTDKAESLYKKAVGAASEKEKSEAEEQLKKRADELNEMKSEAKSAAEKKNSEDKK